MMMAGHSWGSEHVDKLRRFYPGTGSTPPPTPHHPPTKYATNIQNMRLKVCIFEHMASAKTKKNVGIPQKKKQWNGMKNLTRKPPTKMCSMLSGAGESRADLLVRINFLHKTNQVACGTPGCLHIVCGQARMFLLPTFAAVKPSKLQLMDQKKRSKSVNWSFIHFREINKNIIVVLKQRICL